MGMNPVAWVPADMVCLVHTLLHMVVVSHKEASSVDPTYTGAPDGLELQMNEKKPVGLLDLSQQHYSMPGTETNQDMLWGG